MPAKQVYEYAVLRYLPQVEREEFLNLGVIVFSKRLRYLGVKYRLDEARIRAFYPEVDFAEIAAYLKGWDEICADGPSGGRIGELDHAGRFRWLTASRSTVIQCSAVHPGLTADPAAELERLFDFYLG